MLTNDVYNNVIHNIICESKIQMDYPIQVRRLDSALINIEEKK